MRTRVCIADPLAVFRAGVRQVLVRERDFDVLEAANLEELELALDQDCDIVLVDEALPPAGAESALRATAGRCPKVLVWAFDPQPEQVLRRIRGGAAGYLRKEISPSGLVRSLRGVGRGESPLSRDLMAVMIHALHLAERASDAHDLAGGLSAREREVLDHIARGHRNKQIAYDLTISEFTVKRHVQNILHKLDVPSRRAAATFYTSIAAGVPDGATV